MIDSVFHLEACVICGASEFLWGTEARGPQCAGVLRLQAGHTAEGGVAWGQPLCFQTAPTILTPTSEGGLDSSMESLQLF